MDGLRRPNRVESSEEKSKEEEEWLSVPFIEQTL
jgi:hypothetical protein